MRAASGIDESTIRSILDRYDFSTARTVVDVGGSEGSVLAAILQSHPHARATLLDLPTVAQRAEVNLRRLGLSDRCEVVAGDMFKSVPEGADVYILKWILHDWDDEPSVRILANIRKAMQPGSKLLIIDAILAPGDDFDLAKFVDVSMLVLTGGFERTEAEFCELLRRAGLRLDCIVPAATGMPLMIASPSAGHPEN